MSPCSRAGQGLRTAFLKQQCPSPSRVPLPKPETGEMQDDKCGPVARCRVRQRPKEHRGHSTAGQYRDQSVSLEENRVPYHLFNIPGKSSKFRGTGVLVSINESHSHEPQVAIVDLLHLEVPD